MALLDEKVALPLPAQVELKVTVTGVDGTGVTVAVMLVVPYAESGLAPKVRVEMLTPATGGAALTEKPIEFDTDVPDTVELAVSVDAPPAVELAAVKSIVATPKESVSAVPVEGARVATVASVVKVTTTLGTTAPVASFTVAFALAGVLVVGCPVVGSVRAMVMLGVAVVVVLVVEVVAVPAPQPERKVADTTIRSIDLVRFKKMVCKAAPSSKNPIRRIANLYERHSITLGFKSATIFLVSWQTG